MSDFPKSPSVPASVVSPQKPVVNDDRMICERCWKAEMYRMHAV